jgi:hypothetical protein
MARIADGVETLDGTVFVRVHRRSALYGENPVYDVQSVADVDHMLGHAAHDDEVRCDTDRLLDARLYLSAREHVEEIAPTGRPMLPRRRRTDR